MKMTGINSVYPKMVNSYNFKEELNDPEFYRFLIPIIGIFNTSDFMVKIAEISAKIPEMKAMGLGNFQYGNEYSFNHLRRNRLESTKIAYERSRQIGSDLTNYDLTVVDNVVGNSFCLMKFQKSDEVNSYTKKFNFEDVDKNQRNKLYKSISELAKTGVVFDVNALAYNPKSNEFRILDYSNVSIEGFKTPEEKSEYLDYYKEILGL